jgi:hypothetical protein
MTLLRAIAITLGAGFAGAVVGAAIGFYIATQWPEQYSYKYASWDNSFWSPPAVGIGLGSMQGGAVGLGLGLVTMLVRWVWQRRVRVRGASDA